MRNGRRVLMIGAIGIAGCSSATATETCSSGTELPGGNCLLFEDGGALATQRTVIDATVNDAVTRVNEAMPISGVTIRIRANPGGAIPEFGLGGYAPSGREVFLSFDPAAPVLDRSLRDELGPLVAHELHHVRRWQTVGYGSTLRAAMVSEGLADHFSIEVFGIERPMWSAALDSAGIEVMLDRAEPTWDGAYDNSTRFFGTTAAVPRWTGYALGLELVDRYLERDSSRRPSALYGEDPRAFTR